MSAFTTQGSFSWPPEQPEPEARTHTVKTLAILRCMLPDDTSEPQEGQVGSQGLGFCARRLHLRRDTDSVPGVDGNHRHHCGCQVCFPEHGKRPVVGCVRDVVGQSRHLLGQSQDGALPRIETRTHETLTTPEFTRLKRRTLEVILAASRPQM